LAYVKDGGDARFLFENTGTTYYDKDFEMLQVLEDHYHPSSISNTFTTLLSLFNDKQSDSEGIHAFCSRFEGNLSVLSHSSVTIPQILQVMLFLRAIHPRYEGLLNQFASKQKDLSTASIDLILLYAKYMDGFILLAPRANQFSLHPLLVLLRRRRSLPIKMARSIALHGSGWRRTRQAAFPLVGAAL